MPLQLHTCKSFLAQKGLYGLFRALRALRALGSLVKEELAHATTMTSKVGSVLPKVSDADLSFETRLLLKEREVKKNTLLSLLH